MDDRTKQLIRINAAKADVSRWQGDYFARVNGVVARETVFDEMDPKTPRVGLDEDTRDTLIFNGRQDAAHALLNTVTILRKQRRTNLLLWIVLALVAAHLFLGSR